MKTLEKILATLSRNMGYTIVLVLAVLLFGIFSGGLVSGLITAFSAVVGYACIVALYHDYKKAPAAKKTPAKKKSK